MLETLRTAFSSCTFLSSALDNTRPVAPSSTNMGRRIITKTSSRMGVNSPYEVTNVCASVLHQETRNSRSLWLLITDMDMITPKAFFTMASARVSATAGTFSNYVAQSL